MDAKVAEAITRWENHPELDFFVEVQPAKVTETSRWSIYYEAVYRDVRDGTFWNIAWDEGATEYQESSGDVAVTRVYPHVVTVTEYKTEPQA